jgi:biotin transport system substrate-specific component
LDEEKPMSATVASRPFPRSTTLADAATRGVADSGAAALARDVVLVLGGALLTALAAQVFFIAPWTTVPYTLQTGAVLLVGTSLGLRRGAISMALYVLAGVIGLPVYAQGAHGLERLLGATGGYLIAFVLAGALVGWLAERRWDRAPLTTIGLMAAGTLVVYAIGVPVLAVVAQMPFATAVEKGALVFLPWDAFKALLAAGLLPLAWRLTGSR